MIYLAAPYHHESREIMDERARIVDQYAALLMRRGLEVFSPLTHSVPLHRINGRKEPEPDYYINLDLKILRSGIFTDAIVLCLDGYGESKGVEAEYNAILEINEDCPNHITIYKANVVYPQHGSTAGSKVLEVPCYRCGMKGYDLVGSDLLGNGGHAAPCHDCAIDIEGDPPDWRNRLVTPKYADEILVPEVLIP